MKKKILLILLLGFAVQFVNAQKKAEGETEKAKKSAIAEERRAIFKEFTEPKAKESADDPTALLSAADVGEPDSFGKNVNFLGTATTGVVYVYRSCDPQILFDELELTLGADDRCLALATLGQNVSATFNDIGRIKIPKNSVDNVIYYIQTNLISYDLFNGNSNQVFSNLAYSPSLTIESDALNDPAAINPTTGLPMNGSFTVGTGSRIAGKTYQSNAQEFVTERFTTSATRGFARSYFADLGLPQNVINKIYNKPMTIKLNLRVSGNFISFGQFTYGIRFLGN